MSIYVHGINMSNTNAAAHVHVPIKAHIYHPRNFTKFNPSRYFGSFVFGASWSLPPLPPLLKGHSIPLDMNVIFALLTRLDDSDLKTGSKGVYVCTQQYVYLYIYLSTYLPIYLSTYLSIYLAI